MEVIEEVIERFKKYPEAKYTVNGNSITFQPSDENGFKVTLQDNGGSYTVFYEGWHEEFKERNEALNCFAFGLSNSCRLKVFYRGKYDYRWMLEIESNGTWIEESETGLLIFPFWRKKKIIYLQNNLIK